MNPASFYGKKKSVVAHVAVERESCLSASYSDNDEDYVPTSRESVSSSSENGISDEDDTNVPDAENILSPLSSSAYNKQRPVWRNISKDNSAHDIPQWLGSIPESTAIKEPVDYFKQFFDSQLLERITHQSNLYSFQKNPSKVLQLSVSELEQFIRTVFHMSLVTVPCTQMYWSSLFGVSCISNMMSQDRWEDLKSNLHFNENTRMTDSEGTWKDKLFRSRPLISHLFKKFNKLPTYRMLCVDEQMVTFKGMSSLKQYMPKSLTSRVIKYIFYATTKELCTILKCIVGNVIHWKEWKI